MEYQLLQMPTLSNEHEQDVLQEALPQQDQGLSLEQSLELVKIFLNSSIACVCYTRELLRWTSDCLRTRYIEQVSLASDHSSIYDNFLRARTETPKSSQQVRVLVRSSNQRANAVLDMLESGVFDAIKFAYLDVLQVFVASDSTDAKTIIETYTYHFEYEEDRVVGVRLGETDQPFTLLRSQKSFKAAIRGLLRTMQELPRLPKKCVLGMCMSYKQQCPEMYEPPGFTSAGEHSIAPSDWSALWRDPTSYAASFDSTYHQVKISTKGPWSFNPTSSQLQDTAMSKQLQIMQKTSSSRNHALQSTLPAKSPGDKRKGLEDKKDSDRLPKGRRETIEGIVTGSGGSGLSHTRKQYVVPPAQDIEVAATDYVSCDEAQHSAAISTAAITPRRRKKSISRTLVVVDGSTPVTQRYGEADASEDEFSRLMPSSRASSTATES